MPSVEVPYDPVRFEHELKQLGLRPPVTRADIQSAFRRQVKRYHPDRFYTPAERGVATRKLQQINAARSYLDMHWPSYERDWRARQSRSSPPSPPAPAVTMKDDAPAEINWWDILIPNFWMEILLFPIYAFHVMSVFLITVAWVFVSAFTGRDVTDVPPRAGKLMIDVAPHILVFLFSVGLLARGEVGMGLLCGAAFLIVLVAAIVAHIAGFVVARRYRNEVLSAEAELARVSADPGSLGPH